MAAAAPAGVPRQTDWVSSWASAQMAVDAKDAVPADLGKDVTNAWIRTPGNSGALIDFDAMMRDPAHPQRLRREFDSGDGLHPSPTGYRFMGDAIPLSLFEGRMK